MATTPEDKHYTYERFAIVIIWAGFITLLIGSLFFLFAKFTQNIFSEETIEIIGVAGEYVAGIVGALWALAGVVLFYETLRIQRTEIKMQRHELELQRHEIMEQTDQIRKQNETMEIQYFETTFFQLLSLHNEIVDSIELPISVHSSSGKDAGKRILKGRDCFVEYYKIFKRVFHSSFEKVSPTEISEDSNKMLIEYSYRLFFNEYQAILGHYFRNLLTIFKFIDGKDVKNRIFYVNLIHSLLSNYELMLLFFHGLSDINPEFKSMMEKYHVFHMIIEDELIDINKGLYESRAYKPMP